jgi:peptidoglycan hydrolase-like amidase
MPWKNLPLLIATFFIAYLLLAVNVSALSDECSKSNVAFSALDKCIQEIQNEVNQLKPAQEKNQQELTNLKKQITGIQSQIKNLTGRVSALSSDIDKREEDLIMQEELLKERVRSFYIRSREFSPIIVFLSSSTAAQMTQELILRSQAASDDERVISDLTTQLSQLKTDKETLEKSKSGLQVAQTQLHDRAGFLEKEVAKVQDYIGSLSSKQQSLSAQKAGGFQISIGDTPPSLEPCAGAPGSSNYCNPGFTGFAVFSFGAPHRAGMSQYGAYGRAKSGQNAEQILSAYYQGAELKKDYASPAEIGINGIGRVSLEDNYMLGIYEVPESWGDNGGFEALKAQAVAARSYALAVTNNGAGSICTTEACQVYKPQLKSGKWAEAVRATRGWVLVKGGQPAKAFYASTSGGYTIDKYGWPGIKDASGNWPDTAYEKVSASPWFYKAWYKTRSGADCGRSNPWLRSEELADILNAWKVLTQGGGEVSRISPVTTSCFSGNPYSISDLQNIGGYSSVNSVSVVYGNNGSTSQVTFGTNKGDATLSGDDFRRAFNLRAPGYIGVKSELFNIVKAN